MMSRARVTAVTGIAMHGKRRTAVSCANGYAAIIIATIVTRRIFRR